MLINYTCTLRIKGTKGVGDEIHFAVNGLGKDEIHCKQDAQRQVRVVRARLEYELAVLKTDPNWMKDHYDNQKRDEEATK
jgi:hypothetical protein